MLWYRPHLPFLALHFPCFWQLILWILLLINPFSLADKTGTLTKNELTLDQPTTFGGYKPRDVIMAAALASETVSQDAIDRAVLGQLDDEMKAEKVPT